MFFSSKKKIVYISGMSCENCTKKVKKTLENLTDVNRVKVDLDKKCAVITFLNEIDDEIIQNKIEQLGYTVTGIKRK